MKLQPSSQPLLSIRARLAALAGAVFFFALLAFALFQMTEQQQSASADTLNSDGRSGSLTVSSARVVVNTSTALAQDAGAGALTLQVASAAALHGTVPMTEGECLLVIQMQGASILTANDTSFGQISSYNGAGYYEFVRLKSISGNEISLKEAIHRNFSASGKTQVIRVPQYESLTVASGASLTAQAWDGSTGGVLALLAESVTIEAGGTVTTSGLGFRGGTVKNSYGWSVTAYRSNTATDGGEKGESVAGSATEYTALGARYGRGAPANGGGGGNAHNAAGGGGANAHPGSGSWTGQGIMCHTCAGAAAWSLDPGYAANGNARTASIGGGRGGYTYAHCDANALSLAPGQGGWCGDYRRELGGLGGRPLLTRPDERVFLGGGGGAGDGNNSAASSGGRGGGIILIAAGMIEGAGRIEASGDKAANTASGHNDGPGGGGGGGAILLQAAFVSPGLTLEAKGGAGGNQLITNTESEGPGGGGGGGLIALPAGMSCQTSVAGGAGGTSSSKAVTEFPANGATDGAPGRVMEFSGLVYAGTFPVEWLYFEAALAGSNAQLRWATASELNNDRFEIERSDDGLAFAAIGQVRGAGNSAAVRSYTFTDRSLQELQSSQVFYRLRQVDTDGGYAYSDRVELMLPGSGGQNQLLVFPNPSSGPVALRMEQGGNWQFEVLDLEGKRVFSGQGSSVQADLSGLPAGAYLVRASQGGQVYTSQLIRR
ncbi:MAG: T9SS type A sorting domain-containing protein [Bacteroidia bacterium]|nr:T9SS type A sorting domain-containing protein [Bacteroidia bacterium]